MLSTQLSSKSLSVFASAATFLHIIMSLASVSCAIHCALSPVLLMAMPMIAPSFFSPVWELTLFISSLLLAAVILISGFCKHKKWQALSLYCVALIFWSCHYYFSLFSHHASTLYLIFASLFVLLAYIVNHRYIKACQKDCCASSSAT